MRSSRLRLESLELRDVPALPSDAPTLPPPPADAIHVDTVAELQDAVANLQSNQTIVIAPGTYQLTRTLFIGNGSNVQNVTIRGESDDFNDVVIRGLGMDGPFVASLAHGISVYNAQDVTIANLSVGDVYFHAIDLQGIQGADRVNLYHCRFFDAGEQIIKSSAGGGGVDDVRLEYCLIEFTSGPSVIDHGGGTGYTGGVHAHETDRWVIANNLWRNFHTPDNVQHTFAPVVLMWNGSADTIVEGNTFIDTDRTIAFGLIDKEGTTDHSGGVICNNFIYQTPGLFSESRRAGSDGQILVYDSPDTQVYHNTVLTNGNSRFSMETRWLTTGVAFDNNLADAPFSTRNGGTYTAQGNFLSATPAMFVDPATGDLHLLDNAATRANVIDRGVSRAGADGDFDLAARPTGEAADIGADELPGVVVHGLAATYYDNRNFTGAAVNRVDPTVNFVWPGRPVNGIAANTFGVIWQGQVEAKFTETYTFYTRTDEGVRLWVNGKLLIKNWTRHTSTENFGRINLVAGQRYDIRVDYYDHAGRGVARLMWSSASQPKQVIPTQYLFNTPGRPVGLAVEERTSSSIRLSWKDLSPNETGFRVERSIDGIFFAPVATVGPNVTVYDDTGLTAVTTYYYRVVAVNDVGESGPSPVLQTGTI